MDGLAERIDRLESRDAIRQLAFKYALAIDMRDLDAMVNLFVPDIRVSATQRGRGALKRVSAAVLRGFTTSVHHVGNHLIEFDDPDNAHGVAYARAEHEVGGVWLPMYLYYLDAYQRIDGLWLFKQRTGCELYGVDSTQAPVGPNKVRWPGQEPRDGAWHANFPSWRAFWADPGSDASPVGPAPPAEGFIDSMRRGQRRPSRDFNWPER